MFAPHPGLSGLNFPANRTLRTPAAGKESLSEWIDAEARRPAYHARSICESDPPNFPAAQTNEPNHERNGDAEKSRRQTEPNTDGSQMKHKT